MTQSKGSSTPGPWRFYPESMTGAVWANDEFVASVFPNAPDGWDGFSDYPQLGEMRANARLIAAAPALLEACKQAEAQFADLAAITINGEHDARDQAAIEALRAAIQSATGEG